MVNSLEEIETSQTSWMRNQRVLTVAAEAEVDLITDNLMLQMD